MTAQPARRAPTRKYRCTVCHARKVGAADLVACPDCGGELVVLYGPGTVNARRARRSQRG